jgi:DNA-binding LytR/AlgR family response regulator
MAGPRSESPPLAVLPVPLEGEIRLLRLREVLYCCAADGQTTVVTLHGEHRCRLPLAVLAARLDGARFFRAHRAYLVNLDHVRSIIPWSRNAYSLALEGRREVPLSRHRVRALRGLLRW